MTPPTVTPELQEALTNARLSLSDWVLCSTQQRLGEWRQAQMRLIDAAKAVGRAEALAELSHLLVTMPQNEFIEWLESRVNPEKPR